MNSLWLSNANYGWMYLGSDGNRYVQLNYQDQTAMSFAVSFFGMGGSASSPAGYSGIKLWNGSLAPGTIPQKCETKGATLV